MKYNPEIHKRRSIRLQGYDYSQQGAYFVTICTYQKESIFGEIINGEIVLYDLGNVVWEEWFKIGDIHKEIELDEFIVMPNHVHGIILIKPNETDVGVYAVNPTHKPTQPDVGIYAVNPHRKPDIGVCAANPRRQPGDYRPIWQRNYHEHIIRTENEFLKIVNYIHYNPQNWVTDEENPMNFTIGVRHASPWIDDITIGCLR